MKHLFLILLFSVSQISFSQELSVISSFIVNSDIIEKQDSNETIINFSDIDKKAINKSILNHLKNGFKLYDGYAFFYEDFIVKNKIDSAHGYYILEIDEKSPVFVNDSLLFHYQVPKLDEKGEQLYDQDGDPIYEVAGFYKSFPNTLYKLNFKENWQYNQGRISKSLLKSGIDMLTITGEYHWSKVKTQNSYFSNSGNSENFIAFKNNVSYTHLFYPNYYSTFLNNDSIIKSPYLDKIEIGFKASENHSLYEIENFVKPILVNVFMDKLKQFQIDENGNILKTTVKTTDIYSLFYTEKIIKIDEVGEPMYDDEGDQIYITSRTPIFTTDILGIEFHEDWYLAKNSFQLKKEVKGIVLLIGDYDDKGVLRGLKKIPAYISFED